MGLLRACESAAVGGLGGGGESGCYKIAANIREIHSST